MTQVNALSILSLKIAPGVFDLNSGLANVSIRDQIIRASMLIRDLTAASELSKEQEVAFVGAGAAGVAGALACSDRKVRSVVLETQDRPFSTFDTVTERDVGPYMYEWPSVFHNDQRFPPPTSSVLSHWVAVHKFACQREQGTGSNSNSELGTDSLRAVLREPISFVHD